MALQLVLYSTDHCSLCDEALEMLLSMPELGGRSLSVVDVAEDAGLVARFAERLPVLEIRASGNGRTELDWPFDRPALRAALAATGSPGS